jgi:hypothetical protein
MGTAFLLHAVGSHSLADDEEMANIAAVSGKI